MGAHLDDVKLCDSICNLGTQEWLVTFPGPPDKVSSIGGVQLCFASGLYPPLMHTLPLLQMEAQLPAHTDVIARYQQGEMDSLDSY